MTKKWSHLMIKKNNKPSPTKLCIQGWEKKKPGQNKKKKIDATPTSSPSPSPEVKWCVHPAAGRWKSRWIGYKNSGRGFPNIVIDLKLPAWLWNKIIKVYYAEKDSSPRIISSECSVAVLPLPESQLIGLAWWCSLFCRTMTCDFSRCSPKCLANY